MRIVRQSVRTEWGKTSVNAIYKMSFLEESVVP